MATQYRAGSITLSQRDQVIRLFLYQCSSEYQLIPASRTIIDRAVTFAQTYRLRGCDAIQLATALVANNGLRTANLATLTFVAADDDLLAAAHAAGLATANPTSYP